MTFAEHIIRFNMQLQLDATLPENIRVMNPFQASAEVRKLSAAFYQKYYADQRTRHLSLGINP